MKRGWWIIKCIVFVVFMLAVIGFATQWLWNGLVPVLFAGPVITFWQAVGLLILSKIFLWSFGRPYRGGHWRSGHWRGHALKERWGSMTPEEREAFKSKMKERWCRRDPDPSTKESDTSNV
jgi:hypothetical protein